MQNCHISPLNAVSADDNVVDACSYSKGHSWLNAHLSAFVGSCCRPSHGSSQSVIVLLAEFVGWCYWVAWSQLNSLQSFKWKEHVQISPCATHPFTLWEVCSVESIVPGPGTDHLYSLGWVHFYFLKYKVLPLIWQMIITADVKTDVYHFWVLNTRVVEY